MIRPMKLYSFSCEVPRFRANAEPGCSGPGCSDRYLHFTPCPVLRCVGGLIADRVTASEFVCNLGAQSFDFLERLGKIRCAACDVREVLECFPRLRRRPLSRTAIFGQS